MARERASRLESFEGDGSGQAEPSTREETMANHRDLKAVLFVGVMTLIVAGAGIYLGFEAPTRARSGPPVPKAPDHGPILYEMRAVRSNPDRVRLEWRDVAGASGYRVTVMTAADESLFTSPVLLTTVWTIPPDLRTHLGSQTAYHWKLTASFPDGSMRVSDPGAFATQ
jgi:hypothetical protein